MFDDGSRIMQEVHSAASSPSTSTKDDTSLHSPPQISSARNQSVPIHVYYEIERVAKEVVDKLDWSRNTCRGRLLRQIITSTCSTIADNDGDDGNGTTNVAREVIDDDGFMCRIALQFPDDLLTDAPEVSWLMEEAIIIAYKEKFLYNITTMTDDPDTQSLVEQHVAQSPLVFILGDSSPTCCPDEVSANHLNANVIVHYGYACLSPSESVPVVYSFGVSQTATRISSPTGDVWKVCVQLITNECQSEVQVADDRALEQTTIDIDGSCDRKLLIVYDVIYHHAMNDLKQEFDKMGRHQVVFSSIPKQQLSVGRLETRKEVGTDNNGSCCAGRDCGSDASMSLTQCAQSNECCGAIKDASSCCADAARADLSGRVPDPEPTCTDAIEQDHLDKLYIPRTIGGLEIPEDLDLSQYTLLYIGDDLNIDLHDGNAQHRLLQILLRCNSPDGPMSIWSYSPEYRRLNTDVLNSPLSSTDSTTLSTVLSRMLRRRYFLLNKAKLATTIAILIGTTSNSYSFRRLLSRTRDRIQSTGRTAYTFAVGKLSTSGNKLANFSEIDCFVLISCGESITKFWQMERDDMIVPVLSPAELDVALGFREWDGRYSCDFGDLIRWDEADARDKDTQLCTLRDAEKCEDNACNDDCSVDDEPFFSMVSGKYEQSKAMATAMNQSVDLGSLPGQGILTEYRSEAAEFLSKREYRGLEANVGETKVQAAVLGKVGIASDYGEKI